MSSTPQPLPKWLRLPCLILGALLVVAALTGFWFTGNEAKKLWDKARAQVPVLPPAKTLPSVPASAKPGTNALAATASTSAPESAMTIASRIPVATLVPVAGWFLGEFAGLFIGIWLVGLSNRKVVEVAVVEGLEAAPVATMAKHKKTAPKRWNSCNVLSQSAAGYHLWNFSVAKGGFVPGQQKIVPEGQPLPLDMVGRDWKTLFQPRLNIAWLPVGQVFMRTTQVPSGDFDDTVAMVELQLEKLSPLPVTQIVWAIEIMPQRVDNLQTVIVIMMARDLVEKHLGELEGKGFLADRLELPILDQLFATHIQEDGAYLYPDADGGKLGALVAWWYGGALKSLGLIHIPQGENQDAALKEQLSQMAWAGELEGWLFKSPKWHIIADEKTSAVWLPMMRTGLAQSVTVLPPLEDSKLAQTNATRAARAGEKSGILPPEYSARYRQEFVDRLWMRGLFTVLAVYIFGVMLYFVGKSFMDYKADNTEIRMSSMSQNYTNTLKLKAQLEILQNRQALKFASLDCWKATAELLPDGVTIQSMDFRDGKHLSLSGGASSDKGALVTDFNDALRKYTTSNGQLLFETLEIPTQRLSGGGLTWGFSGDLARAEEGK